MTTTMNAVVNYGPTDYRLEAVPKPSAGQGEVILQIDAAGLCGSDGKCFAGGEMFWGGDDPWVKAPVIPGHEFFGTVTELGEGAGELHGLAIGDKAIAEQIYPCDRCRYCRAGQYWMCEVHDIYGFQKHIADGGWAEYMRLGRRSRVHRMPADISLEAGVLVEPLACAIHAVERAGIRLGETVVIAGAGPIGLLMLSVVVLKHPGQIIVTDMNPDRLALAAEFGAHRTINIDDEDPVAAIQEVTDGYGCDVFLEATGYPDAITQGLDVIRKLGRLIVFGVFGSPVTTDWSVIGDRKELDVLGAHLGPYSYPAAIDLLHRGVVDSSSLVTHRFPLDRFEDGLEVLRNGSGVKVMLLPKGV